MIEYNTIQIKLNNNYKQKMDEEKKHNWHILTGSTMRPTLYGRHLGAKTFYDCHYIYSSLFTVNGSKQI